MADMDEAEGGAAAVPDASNEDARVEQSATATKNAESQPKAAASDKPIAASNTVPGTGPAESAGSGAANGFGTGVGTGVGAGVGAGLNRDPGISLLYDVELDATLQFGSKEMLLRQVLELGPGDVVELDRHIAEPVDLVVGDRIVARGEVVVVSGNFGLRILEVATPQMRLESIRCLF